MHEGHACRGIAEVAAPVVLMASPSVTDALDQSLRFSAHAQTGFPAVFLLDNKRAEVIHVGGANLGVDDLERAVDDYL